VRRPVWFAILLAAALGLGVYFRLAHLERKAYWNDEVWTSLWISGHGLAEMEREIPAGRVIGREEFLRFQQVSPDRGVGRVLAILARDDPKQPALYMLLARWWAGLAGDSPARLRLLSVLFGFLALPALYWLCRELFEAPSVAWTAVLLMAVSPFHVLYAQEARPYCLWTLVTIVSGAALLRARRAGGAWNWGVYSVSTAAGLYTQTLSAFVVMGQAAFVMLMPVAVRPAGPAGAARAGKAPGPSRARRGPARSAPALPSRVSWRERLPLDFVAGLAAGVALFLPWAYFIVTEGERLKRTTGWVVGVAGLYELFNRWMLGIGSVLVDPGGNPDVPLGPGSFGPALIVLPALVLMAGALVFLARRGTRPARLFLFCLMAATAGPLMVPDLLMNGTRFSTTRYLAPALLGALVATAFLLSSLISGAATPARRRLWSAVLVLVTVAGVASLARSSTAETWWNKYFGAWAPPAAHEINRAPQPLVVGAAAGGELRRLITLMYELDPRARYLLVRGTGRVSIPPGFSDVFWYGTDPLLRKQLAASGLRMEPARPEAGLWRLR
jgi:uncharacterized membrane protein